MNFIGICPCNLDNSQMPEPAASQIKVFGRAFFKKLAGQGQSPCRSPQRAELPGVSRARQAWGPAIEVPILNLSAERIPLYNALRDTLPYLLFGVCNNPFMRG